MREEKAGCLESESFSFQLTGITNRTRSDFNIRERDISLQRFSQNDRSHDYIRERKRERGRQKKKVEEEKRDTAMLKKEINKIGGRARRAGCIIHTVVAAQTGRKRSQPRSPRGLREVHT